MKELEADRYERFIKLVASNAPYVDFQKYLNLGQRDVDYFKSKYNVLNNIDAQNILDEKNKNKLTYQQILEEQQKTKLEARARQEKLNKLTKNIENPNAVQVIPNYKTQKDKVQAFNTILQNNKIKEEDLPTVNQEQFLMDSRLGIQFLINKYSFERQIVLAILKKLKVNIDLLQR